jgi:hypothetical protein
VGCKSQWKNKNKKKEGKVIIMQKCGAFDDTIVTVKEKKSLHILSLCLFVCSLIYAACKEHEPYYIVICVLPGSTIFFHIFS